MDRQAPRRKSWGWEGGHDFGEQLTIQRLTVGWHVFTDMAARAADALADGVPAPGSKRSAPVLARRALALLGVSVEGWHVDVGDIPDPLVPERSVVFTRVIDGVEMDPFGPFSWTVDVGDDGRVVFIEGTLVDLEPLDHAPDPLAPADALRGLGRLDDRFATVELGFVQVREPSTEPGVVDAVPRTPPRRFRCGGAFVSPVHGVVSANGRVIGDERAGFRPYLLVEWTITDVSVTLTLLIDEHGGRALLVPAYMYDFVVETTDGTRVRSTAPRVALDERELMPGGGSRRIFEERE